MKTRTSAASSITRSIPCDYYGFEYADLKAKSAAALLKIESDYTLTAPGQLSTRWRPSASASGLTAPDGRADNQPPAAEKSGAEEVFRGHRQRLDDDEHGRAG